MKRKELEKSDPSALAAKGKSGSTDHGRSEFFAVHLEHLQGTFWEYEDAASRVERVCNLRDSMKICWFTRANSRV